MTAPALEILIVDDVAANRRLLRAVLEAEGITVVEAADGLEALRCLERAVPAAIITDVLMPNMDGLTFCLAVRKDPRWSGLPLIIYTSTYNSAADRDLALRAGADHYLVKPASSALIKQTLAQAISASPRAPGMVPVPADETVVVKRYNAALIAKLEEKNTELMRANQELTGNAARMRIIADFSPTGIFMNSPEGDLVYTNRAIHEMLGMTHEQLAGTGWYQAVHSDDQGRVGQAWAAYVAGTTSSFDLTARIVRPDGAVRQVHLRAAAIRHDGRLHGFTGTAVDLTEGERAAAELRDSEERFRQIAENIAEVFWIADPKTSKVLYVSPAFERVWGRPCGSLVHSPHAWTEGIHIDDRARVLAAFLKKGTLGTYDEEYRVVRPDGSLRWIRDRAFPVRDAHGEIYRVTGVAEDITDRKRSDDELHRREERFRLLIENASDIITVLDPDGTIAYQSPSTTRILGYDRSMTTGRNMMELIHPEDVARVRTAIEEGIRSPGTPVRVEVRFKHLQRDWRVFESVGQCVRDDAGHFLVIVNSRDITDSRTLEDQFRQSQKMEAIGTLAGGIAHDFNNILAAIRGYTELAQMKAVNSDLSGDLDQILKAAVRATGLVRQIVTFSRRQEQERSPTSLWPVVEEAVKLLRATIPATITFRTEISRTAPAIMADPTQVHQIMMNLCTNAAHAMGTAPGVLTIAVEAVTVHEKEAAENPALKAGDFVRLAISDTGCGMDESTRARIFEPFFTTKGPGEGTGLGLAVVHGIVHSHDGVLNVRSQVGEGTTFEVYFPALAAEPAEPAAAACEAPRGNGQKILYIDDEPALATLGQKLLKELGYRADAVTDPFVALERIRADVSAFDLVITDLAMPGMAGTDLVRRLLEIRPDLPIIVTSGYTAGVAEEQLKALGARGMLAKPPTFRKLGEAVRQALESVAPRVAGRLILVVDDEEPLRLVLERTLSHAGYRVVQATNGNEAIHAFRAEKPDLVLTDLVMPGKEGVETIRELRGLDPTVPIIAMSGGGHGGGSTYLRLARQLGASHTLQKPFRHSEVLEAVDRMLRERKG